MSRKERVKVERPGVKGILAFFLLPQFWRSFGHFSHIKPTFIRTLALMLEQSGLLPVNHHATRYVGGKSLDGKNITISGVMGEAWYHLRTRKDMGVYQWSMFTSLVMMFAIFIGAMVLAIVYILSGVAAEAQFNLGSPTDLSTVPDYLGSGGTSGFDVSGPTGQGAPGGYVPTPTGDLAITILDKVLRQGALGQGGPLQNEIATMYGTYSSAVLIIASIMVFWSIVSIVVDSARTGQFGGGRHNMVWTPIRFVFALGILVPIGGGFNSGQIIIMKLAEWGSNLGTNMWSTYVNNVTTADMLVENLAVGDPYTSVIGPYLDALVCMKRANISAEINGGANYGTYPAEALAPAPYPSPPPGPAPIFGGMDADLVREVVDMVGVASGDDTYAISIGTDSSFQECGGISVPNPNADFLNGTVPVGTPIASGAVGTARYHVPDGIALFKRQQRIDEMLALHSVKGQLELFACAIASKEQGAPSTSFPKTCPSTALAPGLPATPDGVTISDACNALPAPITGGWAGRYPAEACRDKIVDDYLNDPATGLNVLLFGPGGAVDTFLVPYIANDLIPDAMRDGWAGMGAWYYKIAQINRTASAAQSISTTSSGGGGGGLNNNGCFMLINGTFLCGILNKGEAIFNKIAGIFSGIFNDGFVKWVMKEMQQGDSFMLVDVGQWGQTVHPIAQIAATGSTIIDKSLSMYNLIMMINLAAGIPIVGGVVEALMAGPIGGLLAMFASFGMMPGIMLLYYVPLIPWIRVTFAVLAWIVSVVEAVTTMPIIALAHLRTDGEGLAGPMAQSSYIAWLNLLLRPGLTVIGFVMGGLIFQTMVLYANDTFNSALSSMGSGGFGILDQVLNTYLYVMVIYALVNASFKLTDIIPNSTMGWLGGPGAQNFGDEAGIIAQGIDSMGGEFAQGIGGAAARNGGLMSMARDKLKKKNKDGDGDGASQS